MKGAENDKLSLVDFSFEADRTKEGENGLLAVNSISRAKSPGTLSNFSVDDNGHLRVGRGQYLDVPGSRVASASPFRQPPSRGALQAFWIKNKGLAFVLASQVFNSAMNVATRLLEVEGNHGKGFHPLQILFVRMGITVVLASSYMYWKKTEHFPLGPKGIRLLLMVRGVSGFFGVFGMYYSLLYLPLADATVLTFLSPVIACAVCAYLLKEPFSRIEQIAAFVSLFGVVLIARPTTIFSLFDGSQTASAVDAPSNGTQPVNDAASYDGVTPHQKATAVIVAMFGVLGGALVITSLRWIGKRAHPLLTVNYFATWVTIVSGISSALIPSIGFALPSDSKDWGYLILLGACGFTSQFFGAAGLMYEKSSRATNMIYTQMLFALAADKLVFGHSPEVLSIIGSSFILGAAICVAMKTEGKKVTIPSGPTVVRADEEIALVDDIDGESDDVSVGQAEEIPMQEVPPMPHQD